MPLNPDPQLRQQLIHGLDQLSLPLAEEVQHKLLAFITLLGKWNKISNLTGIDDPKQALVQHIFDSLAVLPYIQGPLILDVGSGAGLPGIPLSLAKPEWQFVLLDSNEKKQRFIRQACLELGLGNVQLATTRLEKYPHRQKFATVISRAFAPLPELIPQCLPFCSEQGQLIAMLGTRPAREHIPTLGMEYAILSVQVPGLDAQRHVLRLSRRN